MKGPKYRLPSRIDFTKGRDIVKDALQTYYKRWSKKKGVGVHALHDCKNEFLRIIYIRIDNFTKHPVIEKGIGEITPSHSPQHPCNQNDTSLKICK